MIESREKNLIDNIRDQIASLTIDESETRNDGRYNKQVGWDAVPFIKGGGGLTLRTSDGDSVSSRGRLFARVNRPCLIEIALNLAANVTFLAQLTPSAKLKHE